MPSLIEGLFVDVRGVDLHPLTEAGIPITRASTIATVYGSSPDAQPAHHTRSGESGMRVASNWGRSRREVIPGLRIAEEARRVDQERVEQLGELFAMQLEIVDVVVVALGADGHHPLGDATLDRRPLVAREVEAADVSLTNSSRASSVVSAGRRSCGALALNEMVVFVGVGHPAQAGPGRSGQRLTHHFGLVGGRLRLPAEPAR